MSASGRFDDQIALVTGATSGIGLELARQLAARGAKVVATGRDQGRLMALAPQVDLALTLDVLQDDSVQAAAAAVQDRYGRLDLLINNAGVGLFQSWQDTSMADMRRIMDVNLFGAVRVTQAFLPGMVERGRGCVVNIASVAGERGYAKHTAYCASKHAMIGWSRGLQKDLKGSGVDVVIVCPPAVDTPFFGNAGFHDYKEKHPGLSMMSAGQVAEQTLQAALARKRQVILSPRAKTLWLLDKLAPPLVDGLQKLKDLR